MKIILLSIFGILLTPFCNSLLAQQNDESVIRNLEDAEREAILKGDTVKLSQLMSASIIVQNPENKIITYKQIIERVKSGKISYNAFERIIEKVAFIDNISIVMGKEIISVQGSTSNVGKTVTRRFTNIWMKENDSWKLTARQSTIISIN